MGQQFADAARSELVQAIGPDATTFQIAPAANPYPNANTGTNPVSDDTDWFKLVVQDDDGFEIVYCRTHTSGTTTLSDILRGQEGTTARAFAAGTVVGLRLTAADEADNKAAALALAQKMGVLDDLNTGDKESLVAAINELVLWAGSAPMKLDPVRKHERIELSDRRLVANFIGSGQAVVMSDQEIPPGKWYFEVEFVSGTNSGNASVGVCSRDEPLNVQIGYTPSDNAAGIFQNSGRIYLGTTDFVATASSFSTEGVSIGCAIDTTTREIWFAGTSGVWNGDPSADPATGVGGLIVPGDKPLVAAICTSTEAVFRANPGLPQGFAFPVPEGFTPLYNTRGQLAEDINTIAGSLDLLFQTINDKLDVADLDAHKLGDDHDVRYYTKAEVDDAIDGGGEALDEHKTSADHDGRYYTKSEVDTELSTAVSNHAGSSDHDGRYYTKTEVDSELGTRDTALEDHKVSDDHDGRYYTKSEVDTAIANATIIGLVTRNWEGTLITADGGDFPGAGNTYSANADPGSSGTFNTVIGDGASTTSTGSVVYGGSASVTANSGAAIGNNTVVTSAHSVALGNRSRTYIDGVALPEEARVVSVGYGESHASYAKTRRIINVSDPEHDNDAATRAYVNQAVLDAATSLKINRHSIAHYTMTANDAGALIIVEGTDDKAVVVPPSNDVAFPLGTLVYVSQMGAGRVLLVPGQDVTLHTADGLYTPGEHLMVGITLVGPNEWLVTGAVQ